MSGIAGESAVARVKKLVDLRDTTVTESGAIFWDSTSSRAASRIILLGDIYGGESPGFLAVNGDGEPPQVSEITIPWVVGLQAALDTKVGTSAETLKADKVIGGTANNFAGIDAGGNLIDSGHKHSDYALAVHTHTLSQVTDAGTVAGLNTGTTNGTIPLIGAGNKINSSVLPALAITDTFVVASQAAMIALSAAEKGDVAVRSDLNKSFILTADPYSTLGNWQELLTPTDAVLSVNGHTGSFSLTAADVGAVPTTRTIGTTAPLSGGGALSGNLTLSISAATATAAGTMSAGQFSTIAALGTMSTQAASNVVITGGTISGLVSLTSTGPITATTFTGSAVGLSLVTTLLPGIASAADKNHIDGITTFAAEDALRFVHSDDFNYDLYDPNLIDVFVSADAGTGVNATWTGRKGVLVAHSRADGYPWALDATGGTTGGTGGFSFPGSKSLRTTCDASDDGRCWNITSAALIPLPDELYIEVDFKYYPNKLLTPFTASGGSLIFWDIRVPSYDGVSCVAFTDASTVKFQSSGSPIGKNIAIQKDGLAHTTWHRLGCGLKKINNPALAEHGRFCASFDVDGQHIGDYNDPVTFVDLTGQVFSIISHKDGQPDRNEARFDRIRFYNKVPTADRVRQEWEGRKYKPEASIQGRIVHYAGNPILSPVGAQGDYFAEPSYVFHGDRATGTLKKHRLWLSKGGDQLYAEGDDGVNYTIIGSTNLSKERTHVQRFGDYFWTFASNSDSDGWEFWSSPVSGDGRTWTYVGGADIPLPSWSVGGIGQCGPIVQLDDGSFIGIGETLATGNVWQSSLFYAPKITGPWTQQGTTSFQKFRSALGVLAEFGGFCFLKRVGSNYHFLFHGGSGPSNIYHAYTSNPLDDNAWVVDTNPVMQLGQNGRVWDLDQIADAFAGYDSDAGVVRLYYAMMNNSGVVTGRIGTATFKGTFEQLLIPAYSEPERITLNTTAATTLFANDRKKILTNFSTSPLTLPAVWGNPGATIEGKNASTGVATFAAKNANEIFNTVATSNHTIAAGGSFKFLCDRSYWQV